MGIAHRSCFLFLNQAAEPSVIPSLRKQAWESLGIHFMV